MNYRDNSVVIDKFEVGNLGNNCYVVTDLATNSGIVIDAPFEPDVIVEHASGIDIDRVVITHGHYDHVHVLEELCGRLGVPYSCNKGDSAMMPIEPDSLIADGDTIEFGRTRLRALHTPGHTPGGLCLVYEPADGAPLHLFSGDTLFPGGPGNTQQPLGDFIEIIDSIRTKLFTLADSTIVHPGHGADTTIGTERPHLDEWIERGW